MTTPRRSASAVRAEVERTLREAGGDIVQAAAMAGCTVPTYYQRARRCGVKVTAARALVEAGVSLAAPVDGAATMTDAGVTLTLADYALLRAGSLTEIARLEAALTVAERVIATLTRELETRAA